MIQRHQAPPDAIVRKGYDPRDVPVRGVTYAGIGLIVGIVVSGAMVAGLLALFARLDRPVTATALETAVLVAPGPRLETAPTQDRMAIESKARAKLQGYSWMDRQAGTVRIPIERAMELLAARGWPDSKGPGR